jgi:transposase
LHALRPTLVVLEATGGREVPLVTALAEAGLPVAVVNPRQVRAFAQASGQLATTDALDAQVLARFTAVVRPTPRPLPEPQAQECAHGSIG